jgi:hypothetical protein
MTKPELRLAPPWRPDGATDKMYIPTLRVGYWDGYYIVCGLGGHIIASTPSADEALRLIALESAEGYGAVEMLTRGLPPCGCHGARQVRPRAAPDKARVEFTLADLGL